MGSVQQIILGAIVLGAAFIFGHYINEEKVTLEPTNQTEDTNPQLVWQGSDSSNAISPTEPRAINPPLSMPMLKPSNVQENRLAIDPPSTINRKPAGDSRPVAPTFEPLQPEDFAQQTQQYRAKQPRRDTPPGSEYGAMAGIPAIPKAQITSAPDPLPIDARPPLPMEQLSIPSANADIGDDYFDHQFDQQFKLGQPKLVEQQFPNGPPEAFLQPIDDIGTIEGDRSSPFDYDAPVAATKPANAGITAGSNQSFRRYPPPQPDNGPFNPDDFAPERARPALIPTGPTNDFVNRLRANPIPSNRSAAAIDNTLRSLPPQPTRPTQTESPAQRRDLERAWDQSHQLAKQDFEARNRRRTESQYRQPREPNTDFTAPPIPDGVDPRRRLEPEPSSSQLGRATPFRLNGNARSELIQIKADRKKIKLATNEFVRHRTKAGESLQSLSNQYYGKPDYYLDIYLANQHLLENPGAVPVGLTLRIPLYQ